MLLRVAQKTNQSVRQLFNNRVTTIGGLGEPEYREAWKELQKELGITEDPAGFWELLKDNKDPFDKFVHQRYLWGTGKSTSLVFNIFSLSTRS
ncbi:hypothetical protein WJX77_009843 [Trebouxia sp. C0004]